MAEAVTNSAKSKAIFKGINVDNLFCHMRKFSLINSNGISLAKDFFTTKCGKGSFKNYVDGRGWVGSHSNVYETK